MKNGNLIPAVGLVVLLCLGFFETRAQDLVEDTQLVPQQPFKRYFTKDKNQRKITFYVSESIDSKQLPLAVYVQGSGCNSLFAKNGERVFPNGGFITLFEQLNGSAHFLVVEKPGVEFLSYPEDCRNEKTFNRQHTLEQWSNALSAAINSIRTHKNVSKDRSLIVGHSEGGLVAARSGRISGFTHIASIAGGGVSQIYDLEVLARKGVFFSDTSKTPEGRVEHLRNEWKQILSDPDSSEKFFFGFAYRRWSSFLKSSPLEELSQTMAKVFIAHGTADVAVDVSSSDVLYSHLISKGRDVEYYRLKGANHSFRVGQKDSWPTLHEKISSWYLNKKARVI